MYNNQVFETRLVINAIYFPKISIQEPDFVGHAKIILNQHTLQVETKKKCFYVFHNESEKTRVWF